MTTYPPNLTDRNERLSRFVTSPNPKSPSSVSLNQSTSVSWEKTSLNYSSWMLHCSIKNTSLTHYKLTNILAPSWKPMTSNSCAFWSMCFHNKTVLPWLHSQNSTTFSYGRLLHVQTWLSSRPKFLWGTRKSCLSWKSVTELIKFVARLIWSNLTITWKTFLKSWKNSCLERSLSSLWKMSISWPERRWLKVLRGTKNVSAFSSTCFICDFLISDWCICQNELLIWFLPL